MNLITHTTLIFNKLHNSLLTECMNTKQIVDWINKKQLLIEGSNLTVLYIIWHIQMHVCYSISNSSTDTCTNIMKIKCTHKQLHVHVQLRNKMYVYWRQLHMYVNRGVNFLCYITCNGQYQTWIHYMYIKS